MVGRVHTGIRRRGLVLNRQLQASTPRELRWCKMLDRRIGTQDGDSCTFFSIHMSLFACRVRIITSSSLAYLLVSLAHVDCLYYNKLQSGTHKPNQSARCPSLCIMTYSPGCDCSLAPGRTANREERRRGRYLQISLYHDPTSRISVISSVIGSHNEFY